MWSASCQLPIPGVYGQRWAAYTVQFMFGRNTNYGGEKWKNWKTTNMKKCFVYNSCAIVTISLRQIEWTRSNDSHIITIERKTI